MPEYLQGARVSGGILIRRANIAAVPCKHGTLICSPLQLRKRAECVGVAHIIQHSNSERPIIAGSTSSPEAQHIRSSRASDNSTWYLASNCQSVRHGRADCAA
jgi:hypothetical protein